MDEDEWESVGPYCVSCDDLLYDARQQEGEEE